MRKLVSLDPKDLKEHSILFSRRTLYDWHHKGKHAEIFVKIGRRLFINYDKYEELIAEAERKALERAEKIRRLKEGF